MAVGDDVGVGVGVRGGWPDTKRVNGLARVVVRVLVEHLAHVLVLMGAARGGGNMRGTALPKHTHTLNTHIVSV